MFRKISLPVMVTVMCVMVSVVLGLVYVNKNGGKSFFKKLITNRVKNEEIKLKRTDYSATARKTLDWIDKQRNDGGWYTLGKSCSYQNKTCDEIWDCEEGNKDGLINSWARLNFYEQTKDKKDLEIVKADINRFYEKYKDDNLKDSLWICKITYEMAKSKYMDENTKKKLEELCFNLEMPELIANKDSYIKRLELVRGQQKEDTLVTKFWLGYSFGVRMIDSYFGITTDLINQYLWKKDQERLELAKKYFESGKEILNQLGLSAKAEDECLLGLGAIDLYEFGGKDENVLNYAREKYKAFFDIKGNVKKYRTTVCGLFSKRLYLVTKDKMFFDETEKNNRFLVEGLWDGEGSLAKTIYDNGFYMASVGGGGFPIKNVAENGLIVELIRN